MCPSVHLGLCVCVVWIVTGLAGEGRPPEFHGEDRLARDTLNLKPSINMILFVFSLMLVRVLCVG